VPLAALIGTNDVGLSGAFETICSVAVLGAAGAAGEKTTPTVQVPEGVKTEPEQVSLCLENSVALAPLMPMLPISSEPVPVLLMVMVWGAETEPTGAEKVSAEGVTDMIGFVKETVCDSRLPELS